MAVNSGRYWHASTRTASFEVSRTVFDGDRESVERLRAFSGQAFPPWRFDTVHGAMTWARYAPVVGIPTANGNDPMALARLIQARLAFTPGERWGAYYEPKNLNSPVLDMMNVRYLIGRQRLSGEETKGSAWTWKADVPGFSIYENSRALPRFWLTSQVLCAKDEGEAIQRVHSDGFVPQREAVVEGCGAPSSEMAGSPGQVRVLSYSPQSLELAVDTAQPAFLATSEAYFPGWRAWIDGEETPVYRTNIAFRGLRVPAGQHRIAMRFKPSLLAWCSMLSVLAWAVWLYLWFRRPRCNSSAR